MRKQVKKIDELMFKDSNPREYKQMYKEKEVHCCPKCSHIFVD